MAIAGQWRKDAGKFPLFYARAVQLGGGSPLVLSSFDIPPTEKTLDGVPITCGIDPYDASALDSANALLLPGGGDIDPYFYGEERHPRTYCVSRRRDVFEKTLIEGALDRDLPILAICHGMQMLNVVFGGTLDQHLADRPTRLEHDRGFPQAEPAHEIHVTEGSKLAKILGGTKTHVNSHHHQGLDRVGKGLKEVAWAEDGVLEGVVATDHDWVVGVQWHPEVMADIDPRQRAIFEDFVCAARKGRGHAESRVTARSA